MTTDPSKSCMRDKAMTKLSPWLAHGCLSPRLLYEEVKRYERERKKSKGTYWITHELLWRDFVRFSSMHFGNSIFKIGGPTNVRPAWQWSRDPEMLRRWRLGLTGFPFVDCFMRELRVTGYCNHMGRECAGWFLIGDLGLDWRMGAEWFESFLVDYEPTANWYNWTYRCLPAASRGGAHGFLVDAPGHQLQGLEILKWGTQHDPDSLYIKRWIPELKQLPATVAREPWRLGLIDEHEQEDDEDEQLALAIALSLRESGCASDLIVLDSDEENGGGCSYTGDRQASQKASPYGGFRYGVDYPKPIIQPVSLVGTEEKAASAKSQQAERDRQLVSVKRRQAGEGSRGPHRFDKAAWEDTRRQHPAETPTGAVKGGGQRWRNAPAGAAAASTAGAERKRRWAAKDAGSSCQDDPVRGA